MSVQRLEPGASVVMSADDAALIAMGGVALVEWHRRFARRMGVEFPQRLVRLLDELAAVARESGRLDGGSATGAGDGSAPVPPLGGGVGSVRASWLDTAEAAQQIGIGERAVRRACREHRLIGERRGDGGAWEIDPVSVAHFAERRGKRRGAA